MDPGPPHPRRTLRRTSLPSLWQDERGAGLGEYLIAVGCIAIGGMVAFATFGEEVRDKALAQVECLFGGGACEENDQSIADATRDDGTVTRTRAAPATQRDRDLRVDGVDLGPVDAGEVIRVGSPDIPAGVDSPADIIGWVLDSPRSREAVTRLLALDPAGPLHVSEQLAPALEAFVGLFGGRMTEQASLQRFQRYVADRRDFMARAGIGRMSARFDDAFLQLARQPRRTSTSTSTSTSSSTSTSTSSSSSTSVRRADRLVRWIRTDGLWDGGDAGSEAFRRAARAFGFDGAAIEMVLAEGPVSFIHLDTKRAVTPDSIAATAEDGVFAIRAGGAITASYLLGEGKLGRLQLARLAAADGYPDVQSFLDDADARARRAGFGDTGMLPGSEAFIQLSTWLGTQTAAGVRGPNGQLLASSMVDPAGLLQSGLGIDAGGAIGRGLSDGILTVTESIGNLQRMGQMFFVTKPASFFLGYNGGLPPGWAAAYDEGGARTERVIEEARRSYQRTESTYVGQTLRVLSASVPELPVYAAATVAPPLIVFWNAGKYARKDIDQLATGILVDSAGLLFGGLPGRMAKVVPLANAVERNGFATLSSYVAKNPTSVNAFLRTQAIDFGGNAALNLADRDYFAAVAAMSRGDATDEQRKLVVSALLANAVQTVASTVLSPVQDANERAAFRERRPPRLVEGSPLWRTLRDGRVELTGIVDLPDGRRTLSAIDDAAPGVQEATRREGGVVDMDAASVDMALYDARMRRLDALQQQRLLQQGITAMLAQIELSKKLEDAAPRITSDAEVPKKTGDGWTEPKKAQTAKTPPDNGAKTNAETSPPTRLEAATKQLADVLADTSAPERITVDVLDLMPPTDPLSLRGNAIQVPRGFATRIVNGHANPDGISIGHYFNGELKNGTGKTLDAAELDEMLGPRREGEVIYFRACNLGQGGEGTRMLQELANRRGATLIAPKIFGTFLIASERIDDYAIIVPEAPAPDRPPAPRPR